MNDEVKGCLIFCIIVCVTVLSIFAIVRLSPANPLAEQINAINNSFWGNTAEKERLISQLIQRYNPTNVVSTNNVEK